MPGRRKRSAGKTILIMLYVLLFLSGLALLLYPKLNAIWIDYMLQRNADAFLSFVQTDAYIQEEDTTQVIIPDPGIQEPEETLPAQYPDLWMQMKVYNESIFRSGQEGLSGEESYAEPSFILADFGLESEVFAVLSIPKLELKMPIYLGATWQHMADGAAQMTETSLPIGGKNTNCVIAGHRGWNGAAYFLHIPNLEIGDTVIITNLWETLTYEVVETKIIQPYDVESIHIQPNRDLITLLTCHPPATGGRQRYLVYCERILELEVP
jgi:sortase A